MPFLFFIPAFCRFPCQHSSQLAVFKELLWLFLVFGLNVHQKVRSCPGHGAQLSERHPKH